MFRDISKYKFSHQKKFKILLTWREKKNEA